MALPRTSISLAICLGVVALAPPALPFVPHAHPDGSGEKLPLGRLEMRAESALFQSRTLPSGRQIKVYFAGPLLFADGVKALLLSYQTEQKLDDKEAVNKEVDEVWSFFKMDSELKNYDTAVIAVSGPPRGGPLNVVRSTPSKNYIFAKNKHGEWNCVNEKSVGLPTPATEAFRQGTELSQQGKYREAIACFDKALTFNPKSVEALLNRSVAYENLQQHDRALKDLDRLIELRPDFPLAYVNRALALDALRRYREAIDDCSKAIQIDPTCASAFNNRGAVYNDVGEYEKAIEDCNIALALSPKFAAAFDTRGFALSKMGQLEKALADFNQALKLDPKLGETYWNRAQTYKKMGQSGLSRSDEKKARELGFKPRKK